MPQLTDPVILDAPDAIDDNEMMYSRLATGLNPSRRRRWSTVPKYVLGLSPATPRGFFGAAPVVQPSGGNQAAVPATPISGTAGASYTATEQNLINNLKDQVNALTVLVNAQRAALVSLGLIKGGA